MKPARDSIEKGGKNVPTCGYKGGYSTFVICPANQGPIFWDIASRWLCLTCAAGPAARIVLQVLLYLFRPVSSRFRMPMCRILALMMISTLSFPEAVGTVAFSPR